MEERTKTTRLSKAAREFNVGLSTIVEFLSEKGHHVEENPNTKLSSDIYDILVQEFQSEKNVKAESQKIGIDFNQHETISIEDQKPIEPKTVEEPEFDELIISNNSIISKEDLVKDIPKKEIIVEPAKEEAAKEPEPEKEKIIEKEEVETTMTGDEEKQSGKLKVFGKIDLDSINAKTKPKKKTKEEKATEAAKKAEKKKELTKKTQKGKEPEIKVDSEEEVPKVDKPTTKEVEKPTGKKTETAKNSASKGNLLPTEFTKLSGPKILDKITLPEAKKPVASSKQVKVEQKKKRKRITQQLQGKNKEKTTNQQRQFKNTPKGSKGKSFKPTVKVEPTQEEIEKQIKETLARLSSSGKSKSSKHRRLKREAVSQNLQDQIQKEEEEKKIIKATEFVTANELATMMDVQVNEIISTCMTLGIFVSINQRLDAETLSLVAEEFGFQVEFVSVDVQEAIHDVEEEDNEANLYERAPIVTVMGHVDHGKTLLLDNIRKENVIAGEAGGITQHIGAYEVTLASGKNITFLDTPGHEAFTAMRARGAKVTDVAIIIIAADDNVMPQTKEAINHAKAAGVPIVFAINKIDKANANIDKIKEELSQINILVEDWGGKFQCQEISAKKGTNIGSLLDKVLLEAELLELKGNPNRLALGTVIESSLDKGRGYVAKLLVQNGTIKIGDYVLAGGTSGKVKAMYNERNQLIKEAGPSTPVLLLGLNGAPQAGDGFNIIKDEKEAKAIANKRLQLQREQGIRTQKHITLDEIGRRLAIGDFKELNVIVKGDVDGSVEALSDSLIKLGNEEVQVNVIHKSVGAITETDVILASASDAIIIGFQVRPSIGARKLAELEQIDIRLYSIIYQAIEELKSAIEGMLSPDIEEKIVCNIEIREVFKVSKAGTIAGCMVLDGKVDRNTQVRVIRDGIVVYTGGLGSLKRFKDDVKEVQSGYECGLNIENFNDIKVGDIIEGYEQIEIKRKL